MEYVVRLWCPDCTDQDSEGCFGGGCGYIVERWGDWGKEVKFTDLEMAAAVGLYFTRDSIWEFTIYPVDEDGFPDYDNPVPVEQVDWAKAFEYVDKEKDTIEKQWTYSY